MFCTAYGQVLQTTEPFPELQPVADGPPDLRVGWNVPVHAPAEAHWSVLWRFASGDPWVTVARTAGERLFRFSRFLDVSLAGSALAVAPRGHARTATLRHLFLDQALPLALTARGHLVLHASAVAIGGRAVLLAGVAGAGKSTLAALLAGRGHTLLADDGALLEDAREGLRVAPSYPGLRLYEDSAALAGLDTPAEAVAEYTTKRRFIRRSPGAPLAGSLPLAGIYVLAPGTAPAPRFSRLSRRDAAFALVQHAYRDDVTDGTGLRAQLDRIGACAGRIEAWRVEFPRDLARARSTAGAVARHASDRLLTA